MELISLREKRMKNKKCRRYQNSEKDKLFLTVADGDFKVSEQIINDVINEVKTGDVSYTFQNERMTKAIKHWYKNHFAVNFSDEQILFGNGVLYWIHVAIHAFTKPNEKVIVMPPVYEPFANLIIKTKRQVVNNALIFENKQWKIDFKDLEAKMKDSKLLILCSPHNPTGTIWSKEDLSKINNLALKYQTKVIVDEIWQDVILKNAFIHSLTFKTNTNFIHIASPVKTFNLGGLQYGHLICLNKDLFNTLKDTHEAVISYSSSQPWVVAAVESAYLHPHNLEWKNIYNAQIKENAQKLKAFLDKHNYPYAYPEGTYLFFVKLGNKKYFGTKLINYLFDLGVEVTDGSNYGLAYQEWVRINIAISSTCLENLLIILTKYYQANIPNEI